MSDQWTFPHDIAHMRNEALFWLDSVRLLVAGADNPLTRNIFELLMYHHAEAYKIVGLISLSEYDKVMKGENL